MVINLNDVQKQKILKYFHVGFPVKTSAFEENELPEEKTYSKLMEYLFRNVFNFE